MTRIPEENKLLAWLTAGILVALVAALVTVMVYAQRNFHYTGKGSNSIEPELILYTPTLAMATTLLLLLCFGHSLWRLLFSFALAANVIIVLLLVLVGFMSNPETAHWHISSISHVFYFVFTCNIPLLIIYFKRQ